MKTLKKETYREIDIVYYQDGQRLGWRGGGYGCFVNLDLKSFRKKDLEIAIPDTVSFLTSHAHHTLEDVIQKSGKK